MSQRPPSRQQRREALRAAIKAHGSSAADDKPTNRHAAITREIVDRHDKELAELRRFQNVLLWSVIGAIAAGAIAQLT